MDHRTDIFSLGIVLYEMATGKRPFAGDTSAALVSSILRDSPPTVTEINESLPRHLARIIQHCLEKDPEARYQSAKDVRNELKSLRREVDSGTVATGSGAVYISAPRDSRRRMVAGRWSREATCSRRWESRWLRGRRCRGGLERYAVGSGAAVREFERRSRQ